MRNQHHESVFENEFLPIFAKVAGSRHYTWDMFTNLARPAETQDRRHGRTPYWELKSSVGQLCLDMWNDACCKSGKHREDAFEKLAKRLDKWYLNEAANGYTENLRSKGKGVTKAKRRIAADIDKLNKYCPHGSPWTEKSASLLFDIDPNNNAIISGMKQAFISLYKAEDWESLEDWDSERKWFYQNKQRIDEFVKGEKDPKYAMLRLMKFSNVYDPAYRESFSRFNNEELARK